jgi:hypothetical protein
MTLLIISQIIFNLVISLAVIVVTVLVSVIAYDVIRFSKSVERFFDGITKESAEVYGKINKFLESLFNLSFISKFFKKKKSK